MADYNRQPLDFEALELERSVFERRYGLPSSRLLEAFQLPGGDIDDNAEFHRWFFVNSVLERYAPSA